MTGPAIVIRAIAAEKTAAANIDEDLGYQHELPSDVILPPVRFDDDAPTEGLICGRERQKRGGRNTPVMDGMVILPRGNFTKTFRT